VGCLILLSYAELKVVLTLPCCSYFSILDCDMLSGR